MANEINATITNALGWLKRAFSVRDNSTKLFQFVLYSFVFTYLLLLAFIFNADVKLTTLGAVYALTIPIYYYFILMLLTFVLMPVLWGRKLLWLILIPKFLLDMMLVADYFIFDIYRFHIDMLFINMLLHDFKGIGISIWLVLLSLVVYSVIFLINFVIYKKVNNLPKLKLKWVNSAVFVIFLIGQTIHIVGYDYKNANITRFTPYLPYYAPLTSNKLMTKLKANYPNIFPEQTNNQSDQIDSILAGKSKSGLLQYPAHPLTCKAETSERDNHKPNILIFVMESWRQDVMDNKVTPNIFEFSQQATQFDNHYSGGSVTVNGLFSLLYGLHPTYRDYMTSSPYQHQSLLTKTLEQQGYDIDVYTSSNLDRFSLKAMFFGKINDENYVNPLKDKVYINDKLAVDALVKDLQTPSDKPWFKFVFLSASHHNYQYPEEHNLFQPVETNPEAFLFDKHMDGKPLFNDYKNSVNYVDSLFGELWSVLNATDVAHNTLTIVTSDHGEEFNDDNNGYWGHGSNFAKYQTAVPLIIKQPNQDVATSVNQLTGHIDVVPTILQQAIHCANPSSDYSSGFNLFELPEQRAGLIISSYKDKAYLIDGQVYATGLNIESYSVEDINQENEAFNYQKLNQLKEQESTLLNH
ncbi:sulfatase-like hydrolase/transferase [Psychrosphaera aquimarina]|uniref:Sulfatase-like hydrolase/transferase n=1 Tax=Psychrosphaera aquimarina TaxID=2044854 RepID=A0ABU3QZP8_9GAMM|nr:sulfatase-like hydrolase/transferase [Psychrosphaera aquimarina]MDU0112918.1 sulfatase-like hydrolase/transferase [Psychrosphaera aquimarina]